MAFYRKRPVVIEALRFDGVVFAEEGMYNVLFNDPYKELPRWMRDALIDETVFAVKKNPGYLFIETLEGLMEAREGDWIIRGVKGELYPCKPAIFEMTYESAPEPELEISGVAI